MLTLFALIVESNEPFLVPRLVNISTYSRERLFQSSEIKLTPRFFFVGIFSFLFMNVQKLQTTSFRMFFYLNIWKVFFAFYIIKKFIGHPRILQPISKNTWFFSYSPFFVNFYFLLGQFPEFFTSKIDFWRFHMKFPSFQIFLCSF